MSGRLQMKADEVLIKNGACNILDRLRTVDGARKNLKFPMAFGHEFSGTIVDMGSGGKRI